MPPSSFIGSSSDDLWFSPAALCRRCSILRIIAAEVQVTFVLCISSRLSVHGDRTQLPPPIQLRMPIIIGMKMTHFNLVKLYLTNLLLGKVSAYAAFSFELLRRAYNLRKKGKVRIGGPTNHFLRSLGVSCSPLSLCLHFACILVIFIAEASVELSSGIKHLPHAHLRTVTKLGIFNDDGKVSETDNRLFQRVFFTCSTMDRTAITVWPTTIIKYAGSSGAVPSCPRNCSTNFLVDNYATAKSTLLSDLNAEARNLAEAYDGEYWKDPAYRLYALRLMRSSFEQEDDKIHGFRKYKSKTTSSVLVCLEAESARVCVQPARNQSKLVFFQTYRFEFVGSPAMRLVPVAITENLPIRDRNALMKQALFHRLGRPADVQISSVIAKMAEDGELSARPTKQVTIPVRYTSAWRPTLEWWSVAVFFSLLIGLLVSSICMRIIANRLFPYREIIGEDNIIRVWARQKRAQGIAVPNEPSWLVLETVGDEQRINAYIDEPRSRVYDNSIPIQGPVLRVRLSSARSSHVD